MKKRAVNLWLLTSWTTFCLSAPFLQKRGRGPPSQSPPPGPSPAMVPKSGVGMARVGRAEPDERSPGTTNQLGLGHLLESGSRWGEEGCQDDRGGGTGCCSGPMAAPQDTCAPHSGAGWRVGTEQAGGPAPPSICSGPFCLQTPGAPRGGPPAPFQSLGEPGCHLRGAGPACLTFGDATQEATPWVCLHAPHPGSPLPAVSLHHL